MPRSDDIPTCPSVPDVRPAGREAREYAIELVTPLFGGGVEPRANDRSFPIRPTAIRGQLQFWWRATVGAQYATLAELRAAQSDIWGSTARASRVDVLVDGVQASEPTKCASYQNDRKQPGKYRSTPSWNPPFKNNALPYALFPFQGQLAESRTAVEVEPAACIQQASFRLVIRCPKELWLQVEPAVWAWLNFGGLGSRTRRGCGAILCRELAPRDGNHLIELCKPLVHNGACPGDWPTLAAAILVGAEQPDAMTAWDQVIGLLRQFRQGVGLGRKAGKQPNRPGRSLWPEPDTIRRVTRKWKASHKPDDKMPDAFPRAELGLPIVFHFQGQGEPPDTFLYPPNDADGKRRERMASPLILKPLALQNDKAVPLILRLQTPTLMTVDLRIKKEDLSSLHRELADQVRMTMQTNDNEGSLPLRDPTLIRDPRLIENSDSPPGGSLNGSALDAFLAYARTKGFTEVTR